MNKDYNNALEDSLTAIKLDPKFLKVRSLSPALLRDLIKVLSCSVMLELLNCINNVDNLNKPCKITKRQPIWTGPALTPPKFVKPALYH